MGVSGADFNRLKAFSFARAERRDAAKKKEPSKISRETSSQHAARIRRDRFARFGRFLGSEASGGRRVVAAYLSGRLGEERGGLAEHLRRLGPHGGRAGTTGSCLRGNNKTTPARRVRSRLPSASATA